MERKISFIIPAFNEEKELPVTIADILNNADYFEGGVEIIVVDNGSTDNTCLVCRNLDDRITVIPNVSGSIARLRNVGADIAEGNLFVFIDADISLSEKWFEVMNEVYESVVSEASITGSKCIPDTQNYLSKYWFQLVNPKKANYINSGHLIISAKIFGDIEGFNENLKTAEDVDICQRALSKGISIKPSNDLIAIHRGYPSNLSQFFRREAWHGQQDSNSLHEILKSKTAILSIATMSQLAIFLVLFLATFSILPLFAGIAISIIVSSFFYIFKTRKPTKVLLGWPIAFMYFSGRSYSLLMKLLGRNLISPRINQQFK